LPHDELAKVFLRLADSKPKLLVIDVDLRTEAKGTAAGVDPFDPDKITPAEKQIRAIVEQRMKTVPLLVAQPLIREPKRDESHYYEYVGAYTILHRLEKPNLRFGQVEQSLGDDRVLRRFQASVKVTNADKILNPDSDDTPGRIRHLALRVCELVTEIDLCGRGHENAHGQGTKAAPPGLHFGSLPASPEDFIQFRYSLARNLGRLVDLDVRQIEARADFDLSMLNDAVVVLGSTARGRGDYHFTPLDVFGGETAGVVVLANEVIAALLDRHLTSPSLITIVLEKMFLIALSTGIVFCGFWYFRLGKPERTFKNTWRAIPYYFWVGIHFAGVIGIAVLFNLVLVWFISYYSLSHGELTDPVTPVVAAILDALVDLCAIVGRQVADWIER
jgi:hypothetical protein